MCGWRDTSNVCHTAGIVPTIGTACCYSTCIGDMCKQVTGYGSDSCIAGQVCEVGRVSNINITSTPTTGSASIVSTSTPAVTIIYVTATPNPGSKNNVAQNITPTSISKDIVTPTPPVSGNVGWVMMIAIPVIIIGAALIL